MKNEAFSALKYKLLAEQARKTGNLPLAGILEHFATDEHEKHFKEHAKLYGLVKIDHVSLVNAKSAEYAESIKTYEDMAKRADTAGDANAAKHFSNSARDEVDHRDALKWASKK